MRADKDRLLDILEAIENIEKYAANGRDVFQDDELVQIWMVHYIQVIGEAAAHLSQEIKNQHSELPWPDIISMRNVLVHHYFGIDLKQIWDTVLLDLPNLKTSIGDILKGIGE